MSNDMMAYISQYVFFLVMFLCLRLIYTLDNGLALTPPMGWLAWERFHCNTDCDGDPDNCISENLFIQMADLLIKEGYRDAGYKYVNIDDCWMAPSRDSNGNMVADKKRFPRGIKFLSDYMHERGLCLGIYQDFGVKTCMGYPGIVGHMKQDADAFAKWDVDMVKLDGCHSHPYDMNDGYITMGEFLNKTKKPMLYSCSWPYYQLMYQMEPDYEKISIHCNIWRNFHDIQDSWHSIKQIIDFFGDNQEVWASYIGPGHWTDPDMLMIGNFGLTPGQSRAQMAVWCILPAPLLMSNDLRKMSAENKNIILNEMAISINQDRLGKPGKRIFKNSSLEIWRKPILPQNEKGETSFALLVLNRSKKIKTAKVVLKELGLNSEKGYQLHRVFLDKEFGVFLPNSTVVFVVDEEDVLFLNCKLIEF